MVQAMEACSRLAELCVGPVLAAESADAAMPLAVGGTWPATKDDIFVGHTRTAHYEDLIVSLRPNKEKHS